jgi:integral membrane sensor domain MASE1
MWIHRIAGGLIMILTIVFASIIIYNNGSIINTDPHSIIGVIILAVVIFLTLFGVFARSRMNRLKWKTVLILRVKMLHKVTFLYNELTHLHFR